MLLARSCRCRCLTAQCSRSWLHLPSMGTEDQKQNKVPGKTSSGGFTAA